MKRESLVSITDFSKEEILDLLEKARRFEENPNRKILEGKVVATLFFEPSTRTRLSFETAVNRLGGKVIGFSECQHDQLLKRRNTERHHHDGKQLCRLNHHAPPSRRCGSLCL